MSINRYSDVWAAGLKVYEFPRNYWLIQYPKMIMRTIKKIIKLTHCQVAAHE
jgi:hypothetical protein